MTIFKIATLPTSRSENYRYTKWYTIPNSIFKKSSIYMPIICLANTQELVFRLTKLASQFKYRVFK